MFSITYWQLFAVITAAWVLVRGIIAVRSKSIDYKREIALLTLYVCIVVIVRIVYFPWHHVDGHIGPLNFDKDKILPLWLNLVPFTFLTETYDGWLRNILGNIAMFIPVGVCLPLCFAKLDRVWKTVLAGFCCSLFIEISQLFFYERGSDIDDLLLNTAGVAIGALIWFGVKSAVKHKKHV